MDGDTIYRLVVGAVVLAGAVGAFFVMSRSAHEGRAITVAYRPDEALDSATLFMLDQGYAVEARTNSTVTFSRYSPPNILLGLLLMLLLILPGILYLILGGKTLRSSLLVTPVDNGCRVKTGGDELSDLEAWMRTSPRP